jgi:TPP-dependent pyruvate/acetoin dehydrogenase alpha subunit
MKLDIKLYREMLLIRRFEEHLLSEFSSGKLVGTTHAYIGQEANAVGIFDVIEKNDIIFSNHRCHGHYLAYGGDPYLLAAEIMGKKTGLVGGRGGSQHIQWRNFYSNGIQGGITPIAVGMAFTEKKLLTNNITLVFLGDGTLGQGIVYESFNIASLWKIPVLFVIENNRYAQTTPIQSALAGEIKDRLSAFGIKAWECSSTDVLQIRDVSIEAVNYVRTSIEPAGLILNTYRFSAHSKGDDFRDPVEIANYQKMDPLVIHKVRIKMDECQKADEEVTNIVKEAFSRAEKDGSADISQLFPILQ